MGSGRWSDDDWKSYASVNSYSSKSVTEIYTAKGMDAALNPFGVKIRESRDSKDNPNSNALILGLDVTGSMSSVLDYMAKEGLPKLANQIYDRKPVSDPHIMCLGIGDAEAGDSAPLQATQFEADIRIAEQLAKLWLEGHGGGNFYESYALAWYFAARHTAIDCFEKRSKKGYLFTIGDEDPTPYLRATDIERVLGYKPQADIKMADLLTEVSRRWEVFHVIVEEGSHARSHRDQVFSKWNDALGQRALHLTEHTKLAEVIISAIQITEGASHADVVKSWDGTTAIVVGKATKGLSKSPKSSSTGLVTL